MDEPLSAVPEDDLLATLEPPSTEQYWLSEEELHAITVDPDLGAAFGNPYLPPGISLDPSQLVAGVPQVIAARGAQVVESPSSSPVGTPASPLSPAYGSSTSQAASGEDEGSYERADAPAAAGNKIKRRKHAEEKDIDLAFLGISKEELAVISSQQLNDTVARLSAGGRKFLTEERKAITAARRRVKNREYARDMRDKQVRQMTDLSGRVAELETANHQLKAQVAALQHENMLLKTQLGLPTTGMVATSAYTAPTAAAAAAAAATQRSVLGKRGTPQIAAGACLLVLLFSFGFYFNFTSPTPFDPALQGRSGVSTGRVLLHEADPTAKWSLVASLQRAVFAFRYGSGDSQCNCEERHQGMVCIDKSDYLRLSKRCDLSGIDKYEE